MSTTQSRPSCPPQPLIIMDSDRARQRPRLDDAQFAALTHAAGDGLSFGDRLDHDASESGSTNGRKLPPSPSLQEDIASYSYSHAANERLASVAPLAGAAAPAEACSSEGSISDATNDLPLIEKRDLR